MTKENALKATRQGALAALIVAILSFIVVVIATTTDASGALALFNDKANYLDVLLMLGCAYGMYRQSRFAAVLVFVYYIAARLIICIETGSFAGILVTLFVLYFFAKAIYGSFVFHRIKKQENPDKASSKWGYVVAIPVVLVFATLMGLGLLSTTGVIPSTRVLAGSDITENNYRLLVENNILSEQEKITYFYSDGFLSILEGGSILTDERVISYYEDIDDKIQIYDMDLDDLQHVQLDTEGDALTDSIYTVFSRIEGAWFEVYLSAEQKGDVSFVTELQEHIANNEPLKPKGTRQPTMKVSSR